jgi:multiple sugar transport system permease protein
MAVAVFTGREDRAQARSSHRDRGKLPRKERWWGLLFVSPWLIGLTLFYVFPLVASLAMSFTNYRLVGGEGTEFIGFRNWQRLFSDPEVRHSAWITFKFFLVFLPLSIFVPLFFAYVLTAKRLWGRNFFRLLFYLPVMIPFVAAAIVWRFYLNGNTGWLARFLGWFGIDSPDFLNDPQWVTPSLWLIALWGVGNAMIIYIASLNGVQRDLYEAATIDGAGSWQLFRHVTWPMISPITFYNLVIALVALGHYFVTPFVLTEGTGDPGGAAKFYTMYFYRQTFTFFEAGYGTALAWAMFIVIAALTYVLFWSAKFWVHYEYQERKT